MTCTVKHVTEHTIKISMPECTGDQDVGSSNRQDLRRVNVPAQDIYFSINKQTDPAVLSYRQVRVRGQMSTDPILDMTSFRICGTSRARSTSGANIEVSLNEDAMWKQFRRQSIGEALNTSQMMETVKESQIRNLVINMVGNDLGDVLLQRTETARALNDSKKTQHKTTVVEKAARSSKKRRRNVVSQNNKRPHAQPLVSATATYAHTHTAASASAAPAAAPAAAASANPHRMLDRVRGDDDQSESEVGEDIPVFQLLQRYNRQQ